MGQSPSKVREDIRDLLRARNTFLWIQSREELRAERAIVASALAAKYPTIVTWDCADGLRDATTGKIIDASLRDPSEMLKRIEGNSQRCVYILRDLHAWLDPIVRRKIRNVSRMLQDQTLENARAIIVLSPVADIPPELASATVIEYPLPDRDEIVGILETSLTRMPPDKRAGLLAAEDRNAAIDAVIGLTSEEAASCYAKSIVALSRVDPKEVSSEKRRVIAKDRVLTWFDPNPAGFAGLGGLDVLKGWAREGKAAFSPEARAYGLPAPRGMLIAGIPGTGKSEAAKTLASEWGQPLLRLDLGALKSKYVGESEQNIRKALQLAETVAPCILWIDEIEKALAGSQGEQGDGGVSTDALGALLTWMQERTAPVFVVATANEVRGLPPELLRKGRFDEIFWVDLPTTREREDILKVSLTRHGKPSDAIAMRDVAQATHGFTGAEVFHLVPAAMRVAFADSARALTTEDLVIAASNTVPLSKTAAEKVNNLREWAKSRARNASTPDAAPLAMVGQLDIG